MKTQFQTDFQIDRGNAKIYVERSFNAPLSKVWEAWTKAEILDKWWAPKPWKAETVSMDFKEGGKWIYAMVSPEGERHYSIAEYYKIHPQTEIQSGDYFSDAEGNKDSELPGSKWTKNFVESSGNVTTVKIQIVYDNPDDLDKYLQMGFQEGFDKGLNNLEELIGSKE